MQQPVDRTYLTALLDRLDIAVVACDLQGRLVLSNTAFDALALDPGQAVRSELVPLARAFAGEVIQDHEVELDAAGLPPRRFLAAGGPILGPAGDRLGAVVALHEVTSRHGDGRDGGQVRGVRQLDQLRDEFVAMAGHELRTPLTVIQGYAELALTQDVSAATLRRSLGVIHERAQRLGRLVEDLFDLARLRTGAAGLDDAVVRFDDVIDDAVASIQPLATQGGLTVHTQLAAGEVRGDRVRLRQVLDTLLCHAVTYTQAGGRITVTSEDAAAGVALTVGDTGIGVPEEQLPNLFEEFFEASTEVSAANPTRGPGIGLAVAAAIVRAHGGQITAQSNLEGGTTFVVTLPRAPA